MELILVEALKTIFRPQVLIIIILCILMDVYYKKFIGMAGEFWVKRELKKLSDEYLVINDIMIKTIDGSTHQIDHVVISKYGIFVIETKQYNGYIKGNDYDKRWLIKNGKKKIYVNNPLHQNYGHVKSLEEILNLPEENFISLVCIPSRAILSVKSNNVTRIYDLLDKITSYKEEVIGNPNELYEIINNLNITDKNERKNHVRNAKLIKNNKDEEFKDRCPRCGGELIKRNGKYGEFMGCSNFPKCRFVKQG
jgi:hypothetical protein